VSGLHSHTGGPLSRRPSQRLQHADGHVHAHADAHPNAYRDADAHPRANGISDTDHRADAAGCCRAVHRKRHDEQWFADQVSHLSFDLYCAVLPSGWGVVAGQVDYAKGGVVVQYKNAAGNTVDVYEGSFCSMSPNPCTGYWSPIVGNTAFGPLTGELDGSSGLWSVTVHTPTPKSCTRWSGRA